MPSRRQRRSSSNSTTTGSSLTSTAPAPFATQSRCSPDWQPWPSRRPATEHCRRTLRSTSRVGFLYSIPSRRSISAATPRSFGWIPRQQQQQQQILFPKSRTMRTATTTTWRNSSRQSISLTMFRPRSPTRSPSGGSWVESGAAPTPKSPNSSISIKKNRRS